jgi:hypothetical protein
VAYIATPTAGEKAMPLGYRHTPETLAKLRAAKLGKPRPDMRGDNNPMKRPEVVAKVAAAMRGDNNPMKRSGARAKLVGNKNAQGHKPTPETIEKMRAARIGKRHSPAAIAKMRVAKMGDKNPMRRPGVAAKKAATMRGLNNPMKRPEVRARFVGDKHPCWRGGISREPYAWTFNAELKEEVRRRDGYKCQLCGVSQAECRTRLPVHHIDYNKKNSDPVNLLALCASCNAKVNTNREHWTGFFQAMAIKRAIATLDK